MRNFGNAILAVVALFIGCTGNEKCVREADYGLIPDYKYVKNVPLTTARIVREIANTENYNAGEIEIIDSIGIVRNISDGSVYVFSVININTGKDLGSYCTNGRGPKDMTFGAVPLSDAHYVDGELVSEIYDMNRNKIYAWNISRSIESGYTEFDSVAELPKFSNDHFQLSILDSKHYLCYRDCNTYSYDRATWTIEAPKIQLRSRDDLSLVKEYDIFVDTLKIAQWGAALDDAELSYGISSPVVAPSHNKAVFRIRGPKSQINILDLKSGEIEAIRFKSDDGEPESYGYMYIECGEKYIYALFQTAPKVKMGDTSEEMSEFVKQNKAQVHVFDYKGNLVGRYELDGLYNTISVCDGRLYAHVHYSGRLTEYDLGLK